MLSSGARIAGERAVGWNRQLRITPLSTRTYFRAKVVTGYLMAGVTLAALYVAGLSLGVSLTGHEWAPDDGPDPRRPAARLPRSGSCSATCSPPDTIGPVMGGATAMFALLGGTWFPISGAVMTKIGEALPSYWLVQAAHVALGGRGWTTTGWVVVIVWTVGAAAAARWAYRRDTKRV